MPDDPSKKEVKERGFLNLAPRSEPALELGDYHLEVSESTSIEGCQISPMRLDFSLAAEQISLDPAQVYSTYPPREARGLYGQCLPHVIFHRDTLPWERRLAGAPAEPRPPWLALLVCSEDEGLELADTDFAEAVKPVEGVYNPRQVADHSLMPFQGLSPYLGKLGDSCRVVDLPLELFQKIMPRAEDLPFMAHVRRVSLENKVTDPEVRSDWFSALVANRYPRSPRPGEGPLAHQAHVVSLEDFAPYLYPGSRAFQFPPGTAKVRMFSLYSWEFSTDAADFNFQALAKMLTAGLSRPEGDEDSYKSLAPDLRRLLELGYCPVDHYFREGSRSVSFYRPPLRPGPSEPTRVGYSHYADSLLGYDPDSGLFDLSLSAAWQLGRLMALRQKSFSRNLLRWRNRNKARAARLFNRAAVTRALAPEGPLARGFDPRALHRASAGGEERLKEVWLDLIGGLVEAVGTDDPAGVLDRGLVLPTGRAAQSSGGFRARGPAGPDKDQTATPKPRTQADILRYFKP